jgi:hypothetical protein
MSKKLRTPTLDVRRIAPTPSLTRVLEPARLRAMTLADFPKLRTLPAQQKLRLAEELWFEGVNDASLSVPAWHHEVLSERLSGYKSGKLKTISVEELKRRLGVP